MTSVALIVMILGAAFACAGIYLFAKMGITGENKIKLLGAEFQLSGSALVIFVCGVLLILFGAKLPIQNDADKPEVFGEVRDASRIAEPIEQEVPAAQPQPAAASDVPLQKPPDYLAGHAAGVAVRQILDAVKRHHALQGSYPPSLAGLGVDSLVNALGRNRVHYRLHAERGYVFVFAYVDGKLGTADDMIYYGN